MMTSKRKISFALAVLMTASVLATGCKKTDEDTTGLSDTITTTITQLTQMTEATTTTAEETTVTTTEETTVTTTEETTAETTTAETTAAETTVAETTTTAAAAKDWNETEISEVMYTAQACYSRLRAVIGAETVAQYTRGTKVDVVAATDTGYYKLADGSFIHSDYLTDVKPSATTTATTTEKPTTNTNTNTSTTVVNLSHNVDYTTRYGYKTLNAKEKELYKNIVEAAKTLSPTAEVPNGLLSDDVYKVYGMVFNQEPQLFWLSVTAPSGYGTIELEYDVSSIDEINQIQKEIDATVKTIMATANNYSSTVSKLKVFYDWIVKHGEFSLTGTSENSSIYNGLRSNGELQCAGYAKTMMYLCDIAGIECMTIVGQNTEGSTHAWNVVWCENGYYNLDTTWGDPKGAPGGSNYVRYSFFLVPDAWITNSHLNVNIRYKGNTAIKYFDPPACTKTSCNYYKAYNKEFSTLETAEQAMYDEIAAAVKAGKNVAEIRVTSYDLFDTLLSSSYASSFQKYAKGQGDVEKLARQRKDNEGVYVVQYNIFYN